MHVPVDRDAEERSAFILRRHANELQLTNGSAAESNRSAYVGIPQQLQLPSHIFFVLNLEMKIRFLDSQVVSFTITYA
jgi:hypothetical protein